MPVALAEQHRGHGELNGELNCLYDGRVCHIQDIRDVSRREEAVRSRDCGTSSDGAAEAVSDGNTGRTGRIDTVFDQCGLTCVIPNDAARWTHRRRDRI